MKILLHFERMGKSKGNTPGNNKVQNKQVKDALKKRS